MPSSHGSSADQPGLSPMRLVRNGANWCNLSTPLGCAVAAIGGARLVSGPRGLTMAQGYRIGFPVASAFTVGSVVITSRTDVTELCRRNPRLLAHEERHSYQYAYCLGLPFIGLYVAMMGWSWLVTGDRAAAHFFERQANLADGGYTDLPRRRVRDGVRALCNRRG